MLKIVGPSDNPLIATVLSVPVVVTMSGLVCTHLAASVSMTTDFPSMPKELRSPPSSDVQMRGGSMKKPA